MRDKIDLDAVSKAICAEVADWWEDFDPAQCAWIGSRLEGDAVEVVSVEAPHKSELVSIESVRKANQLDGCKLVGGQVEIVHFKMQHEVEGCTDLFAYRFSKRRKVRA